MAKETASAPGDKSTPTRDDRSARRAAPAGRGGSRTATTDKVARPGSVSLLAFAQESRSELRKVTWPTRQEALNLTFAVVAMTAGLAAFLGLIDTILDYLVKPIIGG